MHERLEFEIGAEGVDLGDLRERKLAREHDARDALLLPEFCRILVGRVRLRGEVQGQTGRGAPCARQRARVGDEGGVRADLLQKRKIPAQPRKVRIAREDIDGDVDFPALPVRAGDGGGELLFREVVGKGAQRKLLAAQVHRIRAEIQRRLQFFKVPRRGEKFDGHKISSFTRFSHKRVHAFLAQRRCGMP